jgi:hypothetical protein
LLKDRATTKGQAAIDQLWVAGWDQGAKYWPQEQADAYCVFAETAFSQKQLEVLSNFYWYRSPMMRETSWFFFVHEWLCAKRLGLTSLTCKLWFARWNTIYNVDDSVRILTSDGLLP